MANPALHAPSWTWPFALIMPLHHPVEWMAQGGLLMVLALTGLYALGPRNHRRLPPTFFIGHLLLMAFWLGLAIWLVSLVGWFAR